jgi:TNF receptor-associated protein 1
MSQSEQHVFQAEIQQLLDIVIHSLYTEREVFVRELISNAADACERLRFLQTTGEQTIQDADRAPAISIRSDEGAGLITIADTGDGMTHGELVDNLGTIAHSGTKAFLKQIAEARKGDARLIGQFGVGFYAAFMVARKVTVRTRSWKPDEGAWQWSSEGANGYELEPLGNLGRGTEIILELKEDAKEFAQGASLKRIIERYSNFVQFPIELNGERVNTIQAIWARQKTEVKEEEYNEFYHYLGHDPEDPLLRMHFSADAPLSLQALLFVPQHNLEALGLVRTESEVHLYCRKVLIDSRAKGLLPEWLRFLRGVVDSEDLPLNISRERMQDNGLMRKLSQVLTGRFLKFLEEQAEKQPETYARFHQEYHRYLKEAVLHDAEHRAALGRLLRFETTLMEDGKPGSLSDYVRRMPESQKEILYLLAPNREAARQSPFYEACQALNYEVILLPDPVDEFVIERLMEHEGKPIVAAEKAKLTVAPRDSEGGLTAEQAGALASWMQEQLADEIKEVRVSERLVDSPALVLERDQHLTASMRRTLRALRQGADMPGLEAGNDLEINPRHPVIAKLAGLRENDPALAREVTAQLLDSARMAAGLLEDPHRMLRRMNSLIERVMGLPGSSSHLSPREGEAPPNPL